MRSSSFVCGALGLFLAVGVTAQQPTPTPGDDVVRIRSELLQAPVIVTDARGRFVPGLKKDDFVLTIDGDLVPIEFFEDVVAGSEADRHRGRKPLVQSPGEAAAATPSKAIQQRLIIFFIDDLHMSPTSVNTTREMLRTFIDRSMGENDLVAIASASGRIGFLQQFSDDRDMLHEAASRLSYVGAKATDLGSEREAPMTEYNALTIENRDDPGVFDFYVDVCKANAPKLPMKAQDQRSKKGMEQGCETSVRAQARNVLINAANITDATYGTLQSLIDSSGRLPGSKLAFFISDGFLSSSGPRGRIALDRLSRITDQARRAGMTFYSIDSRGLFNGSLDATNNIPMDPNHRLEAANRRAELAAQDPLITLANETGGRALINQNSFDDFVNSAVSETARFYLVAWAPAGTAADDRSKKIELKVRGRSDLSIRYGRGVSSAPEVSTRSTAGSAAAPEAALKAAIEDPGASGTIPVALSLVYVDAPTAGPLVTTSVLIDGRGLSYAGDSHAAKVTLAGVILDRNGKNAGSFGTGLTAQQASADGGSSIIYNRPTALKPGLYQFRVAVRDDSNGETGSTAAWIQVPDLAKGDLAVSSLILDPENVSGGAADAKRVQWSVDHRFKQGGRVSFMLLIYNAAKRPGLTATIRVMRGPQVVYSSLPTEVRSMESADPQRIAYSGAINLGSLPPGTYSLFVSIEDPSTHRSTARRVRFTVAG